MIRTALRLGFLPLFTALFVWVGVGVPVWQWFFLAFVSPFVLGIILLSYWRFKADPPQGAVPLWARRLAPYVWGVSTVAMLSVPLTSWPMHRAFKTAKPHFERAIADQHAGKEMAWPQKFGEFEISKLSIDAGRAVFYLSSENGDQPDRIVRLSHFESPQWKADLPRDNTVVVLGEHWIYEDAGD